jgi:hypothetical protein
VAEETEPDRRCCLIESTGEHGRMVVRDSERPASTRDDRLQDVRRLDTCVVDPSVAEEDELERAGRAIGDHNEKALAVAMQELRSDDICDRLVVDQARPRGRCTGTSPDLDDRDEAARRRGTDAGKGLEPREVHRRKAGKPAGAAEDGTGEGAHASSGLPGSEHECEHLVVGE